MLIVAIKQFPKITGELQNNCNANTLRASLLEAEASLHGHQGRDRGEAQTESGDGGE